MSALKSLLDLVSRKAPEALAARLGSAPAVVYTNNPLSVLKSGQLKNAFELGKTNDTAYERLMAEQALFGIPHDAPGTRRPIYGALADKEISQVLPYGKHGLVLSPRVADLSTYTLGDSIGDIDDDLTQLLTRLDLRDPNILATRFDESMYDRLLLSAYQAQPNPAWRRTLEETAKADLNGLETAAASISKYVAGADLKSLIYPYVEAQIHTRVTPADVMAVVSPDAKVGDRFGVPTLRYESVRDPYFGLRAYIQDDTTPYGFARGGLATLH
jgi:hypothetical protein